MNSDTKKVLMKYRSKIYAVLSVCCFIASGIFISLGFDKMNNYEHSEYSWGKNHNAYVGGDAYNYIINGTYSTSFFVLGIGLMLIGCLFVLIHVQANSQFEILEQNEKIIHLIESGNRYSQSDETNTIDERVCSQCNSLYDGARAVCPHCGHRE